MGAPPIDMKYVLLIRRSPRGMLKEMRDATRKGMAEVGEFWHDRFLPIHFERQAFARYGYQLRGIGAGAKARFAKGMKIERNKLGQQFARIRTKVTSRLPAGWMTTHGESGEGWKNRLFLTRKWEKEPINAGRAKGQRPKRKQPRRPLVQSGALESSTESTATISASAKSVRIRMAGPPWLRGKLKNRRGPEGAWPDMEKELTTVAGSEAKRMARVLRDRIAKQMNQVRENRRKALLA